MFGLGLPEIIIILAVIVVFFVHFGGISQITSGLSIFVDEFSKIKEKINKKIKKDDDWKNVKINKKI